MRRDLQALQSTVFDVAIVGGGITGACVAHDAALRGLSVALVEKGDFGAATSAASSKLLHGGIRYLQQLQLHRVRESAFERSRFQRIAPHLTEYVPFLIPTYRNLKQHRLLLSAGMALYDALCAGHGRSIADRSKRVPRGAFLSRGVLAQRAPGLAGAPGVTGAAVLYESHMYSSERMTLAFVESAARHGACVANYVEVTDVRSDAEAPAGLRVVDALGGETFEIRARLLANAGGPWLSGLNDRLGIETLPRAVAGFSKGAHIITPQLFEEFAVALPTRRATRAVVTRGGRHVFVIPWRGYSLIGTSDSSFEGDLDRVEITPQDVDMLTADVRESLGDVDLRPEDVLHGFAGLYPLTVDVVRPEVYQGTGDYQLVDHGRDGGNPHAISVLGAKYTTARRLAERAVDMIHAKLGRVGRPCATTTTPLPGGDIEDLASFLTDVRQRLGERFAPDTVEHLAKSYGTDLDRVLDLISTQPALAQRLDESRESIGAEIAYAVSEEMAVHLDDVFFRRTGLGTLGNPGLACARRAAEIMAPLRGWSSAEADAQVARLDAMFPIRSAP